MCEYNSSKAGCIFEVERPNNQWTDTVDLAVELNDRRALGLMTDQVKSLSFASRISLALHKILQMTAKTENRSRTNEGGCHGQVCIL